MEQSIKRVHGPFQAGIIHMQVFACFVREPPPDPVASLLFGIYTFVDLLFVGCQDISLFSTRPWRSFECTSLKKEEMERVDMWRLHRDYVRLPVTQDECELLFKACATVAKIRIPFNRLDYWLYVVPVRIPEEKPLSQVKTLSDTQAMILICKEFLGESHPVRVALHCLNSRQTLACTLHETLLNVGKAVAWDELRKMLPETAPSS
jgi:hypothetical protein